MTAKELHTTTAFRELLDFMGKADSSFLDPGKQLGEHTHVMGYRHMLHLLSYGIDCYVESDPFRPQFVPLASNTKKILGDNTDSVYHFSQVRGDRNYRISGVRGNDCYFSFCFYGGPADGRTSDHVTLNLNHRDIEFASDGSFSFTVGPGVAGANAHALAPDTVCVIVRQYFFEHEGISPARMRIECLDRIAAPGPIDDGDMARRLRAIMAFIDETIKIVPFPSFFSRNAINPPFTFTMDSKNWGTPDNIYAIGSFDLDDDQALVLRGRSPGSAYWGVQTWNHYMQSYDYRNHRVSLNSRQIELEPDGSYVVHISPRDHGLKNWVGTGAHRDGIMFCRWLLAESMPESPTCELIKV